MTNELDNTQNVIDSRDVIARIEELEAIPMSDRDSWEDDELRTLLDLADDGETNAADWQYGAALIREDYFEDYARELAEDVGAIDPEAGWPNNFIDWEAATEALLMDYHELTFDGVTYYARA